MHAFLARAHFLTVTLYRKPLNVCVKYITPICLDKALHILTMAANILPLSNHRPFWLSERVPEREQRSSKHDYGSVHRLLARGIEEYYSLLLIIPATSANPSPPDRINSLLRYEQDRCEVS